MTATQTSQLASLDPAYQPPSEPTARKQLQRRHVVLGAAGAIVAMILIAGLLRLGNDSEPGTRALVYYTVHPRDLAMTVKERGTLQSQKNVQVLCEVDDIPGDAIYGTPILWIIENGSIVKKGDLVVELEATTHIERLDQELLDTIHARGQYTARSLDVKRREMTNEVSRANAELAVKIAKLGLKQFEDERGGTYQLDLQKIDLGIRQSTAQMEISEKNWRGVKHLFEVGYQSAGDLAQAGLAKLQATTALKREQARRKELVENTRVRTLLKLESALRSAERNLRQVEINNKAVLLQNQIWYRMAKMGKVWHESRLKRYREQLDKCKIYAPQDGMVAYHVDSNGWGRTTTVEEGVALRNRQPIMSIPDLTRMQVKTAVHESVINYVKEGMHASVYVEAVRDRSYPGTVTSIDVLPDPGNWMGSDIKVFNTIVTIDQDVDGIKPGLTAVVEIDLGRLTNVLCAPIQAIVQRGEATFCYVSRNGDVVKCPVEVGRMNEKYVEIRKGLAAGDRIVVDPTSILDADLERNRVVAPDKKNTDSFDLH